MEIAKSTGNNIFIVDDFIREIYSYGKKAYKKIINYFGISYVTPEEIDRKKLNELLTNNEQAKNKWMSYINKVIYKTIKKLDKSKLWFVELGTYLIYKDFFNKLFDKVILIKSNESIRIKRDDAANKKHISNTLDDKNLKYDYLIENNQSYDEFKEDVIKFLNYANFS